MKILLVHNRFGWHPITWLSFIIRVFTCSKWNHIAIEYGGEVVESIAKGVTVKSKADWAKASDRIVLPLEVPYEVAVKVGGYIGKQYGLFDLLRIGWHIVRVKWFGIDVAKVPHNSRGFVCSELAAVLLGLEHPHLITPADFEHMPQLVKGALYETKKKR